MEEMAEAEKILDESGILQRRKEKCSKSNSDMSKTTSERMLNW